MKRRWLACMMLSVLLAGTACGAGTSSDSAGESSSGPMSAVPSKSGTSTPTSNAPTASLPPNGSGAPGTPGLSNEPATEPATEATSGETPQNPNGKPSVQVGWVLRSLWIGLPVRDDHPATCHRVSPVIRVFQEDLAVTAVTVGPVKVFFRDDSICAAGSARCSGLVIRAGHRLDCVVGIRWIPITRRSTGTAVLRFEGVCKSATDDLCKDPNVPDPIPPGGIAVHAEWVINLKVKDQLLPHTTAPVKPPPASSSSKSPTASARPDPTSQTG